MRHFAILRRSYVHMRDSYVEGLLQVEPVDPEDRTISSVTEFSWPRLSRFMKYEAYLSTIVRREDGREYSVVIASQPNESGRYAGNEFRLLRKTEVSDMDDDMDDIDMDSDEENEAFNTVSVRIRSGFEGISTLFGDPMWVTTDDLYVKIVFLGPEESVRELDDATYSPELVAFLLNQYQLREHTRHWASVFAYRALKDKDGSGLDGMPVPYPRSNYEAWANLITAFMEFESLKKSLDSGIDGFGNLLRQFMIVE